MLDIVAPATPPASSAAHAANCLLTKAMVYPGPARKRVSQPGQLDKPSPRLPRGREPCVGASAGFSSNHTNVVFLVSWQISRNEYPTGNPNHNKRPYSTATYPAAVCRRSAEDLIMAAGLVLGIYTIRGARSTAPERPVCNMSLNDTVPGILLRIPSPN